MCAVPLKNVELRGQSKQFARVSIAYAKIPSTNPHLIDGEGPNDDDENGREIK